MTASAINDPDLVQAIEDLHYDVTRLEQLDRQIVDADEVEGYQRIVSMRAERDDLRGKLRGRAEKLAIHPRALFMLVGQANRMRTARKAQLPTLAAVRSVLDVVRSAAERDHTEAEAEAKIARVTARAAAARAKAANEAITYLEASRS